MYIAPPFRRRFLAVMMTLPGILTSIAHAQLSGVAALPQTLSPLGLQLSPQLQDYPVVVQKQPAVFARGDYLSAVTDKAISIEGAAEVRQGSGVVRSDHLHYDQDTDRITAQGHVLLLNRGIWINGTRAEIKANANQGIIQSPHYHFVSNNASGQAKQINLLDNSRTEVIDGTYTACGCEKPAWYIRGQRFEFDTDTQTGVAYNSVLFFQGFPLFATPVITFPLNNERRSGLLPPMFSLSSTNGFDISFPYYVNIAPNRDLTITPRLLSKRGVQTQLSYRYLSNNYSGSFTGEYLPDDKIAHRDRYAIYWNHQQNLGHGLNAFINYNRVSDNAYSEDFATTDQFLTGTQTLFAQQAGVTYQKGPWSVLAQYLHWQTLPPSIAPYDRTPQLNVQYHRYDVAGFDFGAEADYSHFEMDDSHFTDGSRFVLNPYLSYHFVRPGYFFVPKVQMHFASYDLKHIGNNLPMGPKNFTESIPTVSVDSGLVFQRYTRILGQTYLQTLEPRLYYVYAPFRDQSFIPLFDTAESDFGLAEIFTPNTFVGNDRIADSNRITAALTTRFINPETGDERASFIIAQQYYFQNQRVSLTPNNPVNTASRSDILFGSAFKLATNFASEIAFQYNNDTGQLVRSSVGFSYVPSTGTVLNLAYRYTRSGSTLAYQAIDQILFSSQWTFTKHFSLVGRLNYDVGLRKVIDGLLGFQYQGDCWTLGAGIQRYANGFDYSTRGSDTTRFLMQLTLKGLSTVDNGLIKAFETSVSGYTNMPEPVPMSRFTDYQ